MIFPYIGSEPIVPLDIQTQKGEWHRFHAYIDSGAGYFLSFVHLSLRSKSADLICMYVREGF